MQRSSLAGSLPRLRRGFFLGLAVVCFCTGRSVEAAKSYDLLLNVPPGKILKYRLDSSSDGNYQGTTFTNTVAADLEVSRVADAKSDNPVFLVNFVKVEASARQGDNLVPQELGLDGKKAQVEVTTRGRLVKVEPQSNVTEMQARLLENFANALFLELPDKPVAVDDTWKIDLHKSGGGAGSGDYTLAGIGKRLGVQVAKLSGELKLSSSSPPLEGGGTVESEVALEGGYTVASKGSVDLKGEGPSIVQSYELKLKP